MDGAGDIVAISLPFVAGVAASCILPVSYVIPSAALALSCLFLILTVSGPSVKGWCIPPAYFFLGILCHSSSAIYGTAPDVSESLHRMALDRFRNLLDRSGLADDGTRGLVCALLTGDRRILGKDVIQAFRLSGASHILALSGLHLGVIYLALNRVLSVFGKSRTASIVRSGSIVAFSAIYVLATGAAPSLVRAFIFIVLNELSKQFPGRTRQPLRILLVSLTIHLAVSPSSVASLGFQLSYLAMLGITLVFPVMDAWYPGSGNAAADRFNIPRRIWTSVSMTVSCQLFTAPLVWLRFGTFPEYFLLTNLLALPLSEALILASLSVLILSSIGICPGFLVSFTDGLARVLVSCLELISSM